MGIVQRSIDEIVGDLARLIEICCQKHADLYDAVLARDASLVENEESRSLYIAYENMNAVITELRLSRDMMDRHHLTLDGPDPEFITAKDWE